MSLRSAVVVVVDRLGAGFLGPYGNTWLDTPALNHLASRSLLCETVLADSPRLADVYRSYWTGRHVLAPLSGTLWTDELTGNDVTTVLVTDEPAVAGNSLAKTFGQIVHVPAVSAQQCADDPAETGLARLFAAAAEALAALAPPYLLWVHSRGMEGPWDAPLEFREQFRDEEDPLPGNSAVPPQLQIAKDFDPDETLKVTHAYAGQVSLFDQQISALLEILESRSEPELLVALTSPRGYPLGEHGRIGPCDEALYGELLHVPLLVQFPQQQGALTRTHQVLEPADLGAAIAAHFDLPAPTPSILWQLARNETVTPREMSVAVGENQRAIRTPAWFLREVQAGDQRRYELFAKPDDRWEVNEVSSRCEHEVELLAAALDRFQQAAREGKLAELAPLPEFLRDTWR